MSTGGAAIGRIVVGVDGSQPSRAALRWAVRQAHFTCSEVDAVMAWDGPAQQDGRPGAPAADLAAIAVRALAETVHATVLEEGDAVDIRQRTRQGDAVRILLDASREAELLVVGCRGRSGIAATVLGSVSTQCAQQAGCPVVVVHGDG